MALTLDGDGVLIHGPTLGMIAHLIAHGGERLPRAPRRFPPRIGSQLVLVLIEADDRAIWITEADQFAIAKDAPGLKVWLYVPNAPLLTADRRPLVLRVDDGPGECPALALLGGFH